MATITDCDDTAPVGIKFPLLKHHFKTTINKNLDPQIVTLKFKKLFDVHTRQFDKVILQIWVEDCKDNSVIRELSHLQRNIPEIRVEQLDGNCYRFRTLIFSFCKVQSIDYELSYSISGACQFLITLECQDVNYE